MSEETGPTALTGSGEEARCPEASGSHHNRAEMAESHNTQEAEIAERWDSNAADPASQCSQQQTSFFLLCTHLSLEKIRI